MYGTLEDWRTYANARGVSAPLIAGDADATAALMRGSDYVRLFYVQRMVETISDPVPEAVEHAAYEAATLELATPGFFSKSYTPAEQKVLVGVGNIRWEVVGKKGRDNAMPVSTKIEALLYPYLTTRHLPAVVVF